VWTEREMVDGWMTEREMVDGWMTEREMVEMDARG
jgi:hypothetical protein